MCSWKIFFNYGFRCFLRFFLDLNLNDNNFGVFGSFNIEVRIKERDGLGCGVLVNSVSLFKS